MQCVIQTGDYSEGLRAFDAFPDVDRFEGPDEGLGVVVVMVDVVKDRGDQIFGTANDSRTHVIFDQASNSTTSKDFRIGHECETQLWSSVLDSDRHKPHDRRKRFDKGMGDSGMIRPRCHVDADTWRNCRPSWSLSKASRSTKSRTGITG